ncbi:MAG TPA: UDP-N-acetylglucosamine 1-carboxyvinyltransferase, partial [Eubacteriales bacterium]|jgi:UDP-N-acetylglucosamine 1-carboxyvinyltransferase|nr:UDP-N-acetylglucosamine 1-carboxyvinyltransferase [Clostridia bacterium]HRR90149.1 UDP-N-acetylglucosamine 1-carboxyvinyltransferase [Eubacteriales bacterium]HRU84130.1 UDP-N-acetylglucosamine 1-carboxyvinyltransferase [Eubacteriales bacterium]
MDKLEIRGGKKLAGSTRIKGAKNAVLPLLAASILTDEATTIKDCPQIADVEMMQNILKLLGVSVVKEGGSITTYGRLEGAEIPGCLAREMRSSIFLLGAILAREKHARVAYPGGCEIGKRPINLHIDGFRRMNIGIEERGDEIICSTDVIKGADICLKIPSVGATENLILAGALAEGVTTIRNAAREPEITDLQDFINAMGGKVSGAGTAVIKIQGVDGLHGAAHTPIPDRITAGTLIIAVCVAGGEITLENVEPSHLCSLLTKLPKSACGYRVDCDNITVYSRGRGKCISFVETEPYPGFPTDLQPQFMTLMAVSNGVGVIRENIFENRFAHAAELRKMDAAIIVDGVTATVTGGRLKGAEVTANDLRGGAGLVLAGLAAEGVTTVLEPHHIDRGYEKLEAVLASLGADIKRITL